MKPLPASILLTLSFTIMLMACSSEMPSSSVNSATRAPVIRSASITPDPILRSTSANLQVTAEDPDQGTLTFRVRWYADDRLLEDQTTTQLDSRLLSRGMRIRADVIASNGKAESQPYRSGSVMVGNTPPEVKSVVPEAAVLRIGDPVRLRVESVDADDDSITYTYRWWRNTSILAEGDVAEIQTAGFSRGDSIVAEVTPHDSSSAGRPLMTEPITLGNTPPTITSTPPGLVNQGRYQYAVTAMDPDGDALSYSLETGPAGMTIDKTTGRIEWQLSPGLTGSQHVRVVVEDSQQGRAFQEFDLSIPVTPTS